MTQLTTYRIKNIIATILTSLLCVLYILLGDSFLPEDNQHLFVAKSYPSFAVAQATVLAQNTQDSESDVLTNRLNELRKLLLDEGYSTDYVDNVVSQTEDILRGKIEPVSCKEGPDAPCCRYEDGSLAGPCDQITMPK